jgi:hypothetical protein
VSGKSPSARPGSQIPLSPDFGRLFPREIELLHRGREAYAQGRPLEECCTHWERIGWHAGREIRVMCRGNRPTAPDLPPERAGPE